MAPRAAAQPTRGVAGFPHDVGKRVWPLMEVQRRVFSRECVLSAGARLVALAIAAHMNSTPEDEGHVAFVSERRLAAQTDLSVRTVRGKLHEIQRVPDPLFELRLGGVTRGHPHRCYSFRLVGAGRTGPEQHGSRHPVG